MSVPKPNACCNDEENLVLRVPDPSRPKSVVRTCRVCGCRHFEMTADSGRLGTRGAPIGGVASGVKILAINQDGTREEISVEELMRRLRTDESQEMVQ